MLHLQQQQEQQLEQQHQLKHPPLQLLVGQGHLHPHPKPGRLLLPQACGRFNLFMDLGPTLVR